MFKWLVQKVIFKLKDEVKPKTKKKYHSINYVGVVSKRIQRTCKGRDPSVVLAYKTQNTLYKSVFTKTKDRLDPNKQSDLVYSIPCQQCNAIYIGETCRKLETRLREHQLDVKNSRTKTGLSTHAIETGHNFDFDRAKVIHNNLTNTSKRKIIECLYILRHRTTTVNKMSDVVGLDVYKHLSTY